MDVDINMLNVCVRNSFFKKRFKYKSVDSNKTKRRGKGFMKTTKLAAETYTCM